jgi:signal transduction histidine kinase
MRIMESFLQRSQDAALKQKAKEQAPEKPSGDSDAAPDKLEPPPMRERPMQTPALVFLLVMAILAFIDHYLMLNTLLLESVHALVVTCILLSCVVFERRHPHIRQFGWHSIVFGIGFLMLGTWVDILDDPPLLTGPGVHFPLGPSWERAFLKTTMGYTMGIGLFAYGFFQWIPWMIRTRLDMLKFNNRLSLTNRNLNRALMSLDEHIESERVAISRELHDDVAQQLTFVNVQIQLCRKEIDTVTALAAGEGPWDRDRNRTPADPSIHWERAREKLNEVADNVSEALRSVRQISGDLRPESLFSLGLVPALEQFIDKIENHAPDIKTKLTFLPLVDGATHTFFEKKANDAKLLHLFRIIQEGTRNAIKHAEPTYIDILLEEFVDPEGEDEVIQLRIAIEDNGKGLPWKEIPPDEVLIQQGHLGIVGLKERVRELGGSFQLSARTSEPVIQQGPGARLEIIVA